MSGDVVNPLMVTTPVPELIVFTEAVVAIAS